MLQTKKLRDSGDQYGKLHSVADTEERNCRVKCSLDGIGKQKVHDDHGYLCACHPSLLSVINEEKNGNIGRTKSRSGCVGALVVGTGFNDTGFYFPYCIRELKSHTGYGF